MQRCDDWAPMDRLKEEFEALGLYLSAHPLDSYANQLQRLRVMSSAELGEMIEARTVPQRVNLAGSVTAKQVRVSQRGNKFAFVQLTDRTGVFEVTFFSDVLAASQEVLDDDKPVLMSVNVKIEENGPRLLAARVQALDDAIAAWHGGIGVWVQNTSPLGELKDMLVADGPGKADVKINVMVDDLEVTIALPGRFKLSGDFRQNLRRLPGVLDVREL